MLLCWKISIMQDLTSDAKDCNLCWGIWCWDGDCFDPEPRNHMVVCVRSRIGCAMNCSFCYATKIGLKRICYYSWHSRAACDCGKNVQPRIRLGIVTNVMFMDMREPFENIHNMITAHFGLFYIEKFIVMNSNGKYYCCASQQIEENIWHLKSNDVNSPRSRFPWLKNEYASKFGNVHFFKCWET